MNYQVVLEVILESDDRRVAFLAAGGVTERWANIDVSPTYVDGHATLRVCYDPVGGPCLTDLLDAIEVAVARVAVSVRESRLPLPVPIQVLLPVIRRAMKMQPNAIVKVLRP